MERSWSKLSGRQREVSLLRLEWRLLILIGLFVTFIVVGHVSDRYVLRTTSQLQHLAKGLELAVRTDSWSAAKDLLNDLSRQWPVIRRIWDLRMHRDEMDDLDLCIARMGGYVTEQDKAGVLSELQAWRTLLTHIEQKEVFRWRNLL